MILAFSRPEDFAYLYHFLRRSEICEGYVKLGIFHVHVHADHALVFRKGQTCFDSIVEEVANDAAQVQLGHFQFHRDMGIYINRNLLGPCQRYFAV